MKPDLAEKLQTLRAEKKVNQRQASKDLGISQALLSHYEHGVREPRLEFIVKAGEYYGVSADYLLGREEIRRGGTPAGGGSSELERLDETLGLLFAVLGELSHDGLCAAAAVYLGTVAVNIFEALAQPEVSYDPMRDAALKAAEAQVRAEAGRAVGASGQEYTVEALKSRHPERSQALSEINDKVSETVNRLKMSCDIG